MIKRDQTVQRFPLGGWQRSRSRPRRAADDRPLGTHPRPVADAASACPCQRPSGRSQRPAGACAWSTRSPPAAGTSQTPGDDSGRPKHTGTGLAMADNGKSLRWLEFSRNLDPYTPHSRRFDHPSKPRARRLVRGRPSTPRLTLVQEARTERPAVVVRSRPVPQRGCQCEGRWRAAVPCSQLRRTAIARAESGCLEGSRPPTPHPFTARRFYSSSLLSAGTERGDAGCSVGGSTGTPVQCASRSSLRVACRNNSASHT